MATTRVAEAPRAIMLATDLTPAADRAFDRAVQLAAQWKAALTVCHVVEASSARPWGIERRLKNAETELDRLLRARAQSRSISITRHVIFGDPAERIVEHARAIGTDLLVTGPAHVKVLGERLLGSTAARVLRHAGRPVLSVRRREDGPYQNVVVSVDFSETSRGAYHYSRALFPQAQFTVIHAYEVSPDWSGRNADRSLDVVEAEEKARVIAAARQDMADLTTTGSAAGLKYASVMEQGSPEAVLMGHVEKQWPDLVVTGTLGRSASEQATIGSVTERFMHVLPCDVMAVRPAA